MVQIASKFVISLIMPFFLDLYFIYSPKNQYAEWYWELLFFNLSFKKLRL